MKKKAKIIVLSAAGLLTAAVAAVVLLMPVKLEAVELAPRALSLTFTEQGSYTYDREFSVFPLVAGAVLEVAVLEGQQVAEGDVLVVVDAADYEHQIRQLQSSIDGYNGQISNLWQQEQQRKDELAASLENLRGQLKSLDAESQKNDGATKSLDEQIRIQEAIVSYNKRASYGYRDDLFNAYSYGDDSQLDLARQGLNAANNTLAQSELLLEQLKAGEVPESIYEGQRDALNAQIEAAQLQLGKSYSGGMQQFYNAQIQSVQASIEQMREQAGRAEIRSPVSGRVAKLPVKDQNAVTQQAQVAVVGGKQYVEVFVPTREIDGLQVGDAVELLLERRLGKESFGGRIAVIEQEATVKLSVLGVEERKVRVLVTPEDEHMLKTGYDMDVRFTVEEWEDALAVPKTAVFTADGADCVWVIADGRLALRQIGKGAETREGYIVQSGLAAGEMVVADCDNGEITAGKRAQAIS